MTITWTKCSDRMPPDNNDNIIIRSNSDDERIRFGSTINLSARMGMDYSNHEWCVYNGEVWRELGNGAK